MYKIFFLFLIISSSAKAYVGEEILGTWGNLKLETFLQFTIDTNPGYFDNNLMTGFITAYDGGNYDNKGTFTFKGKILKITYERSTNKSQEIVYPTPATFLYRIKMGLTEGGTRYIMLYSINSVRKKQPWGPFYFRGDK